MIVPTRDGKRRRNEGRDVVRPVLVALNRLPGVRVVRNLVALVVPASKRDDPSVRPMWCGLGLGSADIVGIVKLTAWDGMMCAELGRPFALECKLPKQGHLKAGAMKPDQELWLPAFRRAGGFAAVVRTVEEAVDAVNRCRAGASE